MTPRIDPCASLIMPLLFDRSSSLRYHDRPEQRTFTVPDQPFPRPQQTGHVVSELIQSREIAMKNQKSSLTCSTRHNGSTKTNQLPSAVSPTNFRPLHFIKDVYVVKESIFCPALHDMISAWGMRNYVLAMVRPTLHGLPYFLCSWFMEIHFCTARFMYLVASQFLAMLSMLVLTAIFVSSSTRQPQCWSTPRQSNHVVRRLKATSLL